MSENVAYGFAVGRIRVQETTLLDRSRYERLVRAANAAELRSVLTDTCYGRYIAEDAEPHLPKYSVSFNRILIQAAADNFDFLARYCTDHWVLDAFRLRADIHNLKLAVKHRLLGTESVEAQMFPYGTWHASQVRALAAAEPGAEPSRVRHAVVEALKGPEPWSVDAVFDRLEQELVLELVRPSLFLSRLFAIHADVENLRTLVRIRLTGRGRAVLRQVFLPGGELTLTMLTELLGADLDTMVARFRFSRYRELVEQGHSSATNRAFRRTESLGRELLLNWLKLARYATFGYEPLVSYYLFRENEITNLRQLFAAKAAGATEQECRELIAYVD
ncbi:MAG: V-type ATPase subunit [candidate division WOR-3 bacterium]